MSDLEKLSIKEARLRILDDIYDTFKDIKLGKVRQINGATEPKKFDGIIYDSNSRRFSVNAPLVTEVVAFDNKFHNNDGGILLYVRITSSASALELDLPNLETLMKGSSLKNSRDSGKYIGHIMDEGPKVGEYVIQSRPNGYINNPEAFSALAKQDPYPVEMHNISQYFYELNFHKNDLGTVANAVKKQRQITEVMTRVSMNKIEL